MTTIVSVNPFRCRMWTLHDRLQEHITEETCRAEIESFSRHGQRAPALGRPLQANRDYDVELIYGARRLFIARHTNTPLLVELRDLTDQEAIVAIDIENRLRKDVSPYERGLSYQRWLNAGLFRAQEDIARLFRISPSQVSRLLRLARLPSVLVDAFPTPTEICEGWGVELVQALDNPQQRQAIIQKARAIVAGGARPPASEVYRQLLAAHTRGRKPRRSPRDEVVASADGKPLFRISERRSCVALLLPLGGLSERMLSSIRSAVLGILQGGREQARDGVDQEQRQSA